MTFFFLSCVHANNISPPVSIFVGGSCRARVVMRLSKKFASPSMAEEQLRHSADENRLPLKESDLLADCSYSPINIEHVSRTSTIPLSPVNISASDPLFDKVMHLSSDEQLQLGCDVFNHVASCQYGISVPDDFIRHALSCMKQLAAVGKPNVIYGLCKGLGTIRPGGSDSYFPTSRMPMGLLQYMVEFFITQPGHRVSIN